MNHKQINRIFLTAFTAILILLWFRYAYADADEVLDYWRYNGMLALEKMDGLAEKAASDKRAKYEQMLLSAYAAHVDNKDYENVHKLINGVDFYKVILNKGNDESFCISYGYNNETSTLVAIKIELLPKGWNLRINPLKPGLIILDLNDEGYAISFDVANPFSGNIELLEELIAKEES
jgi:hypothetical protein